MQQLNSLFFSIGSEHSICFLYLQLFFYNSLNNTYPFIFVVKIGKEPGWCVV